jgi:muramidase (phage lysozyme)
MAKFLQDPQLPQANSYVGLSKEPDKLQPNKTLGTLFAGLGSTLEGVVGVIDQENKSQIDKALYEGIDAARDEQGVGAAIQQVNSPQILPEVASNSGAGPAAPPQIDRTVSEIQRFTAAKNDGKINDTYYWTKVEALVREVRSKYPGYREEIDKKVSSITGTTPANALRNSIQADLVSKQSANDKAIEKREKYLKDNYGNMTDEQRTKIVQGDRSPALLQDVEATIAGNVGKDAEITRQRAALGRDAELGKASSEAAYSTLISESNQYVDRVFNQAADQGSGGRALAERIDQLIKSGKGATPEEQQQIMAQFNALETQLALGLDKIASTPLGGNTTQSYASVLKDPGKVNQAKEQALARIAVLKNALIQGDFALFKQHSIMIKASEDANTRKFLEENQAAQQLQIATKILGPNAGVYLSTPAGAKALTATAEALSNFNIAETVQGKGNLGNQMTRLKEEIKKDPTVAVQHLDKTSRILGDVKATPEALLGASQTVYGTGNDSFLNMFKDSSKEKAYAKLTTPEITKNMGKLKETNPEAWERYRRWTINGFQGLNQQTFADVKEFAKGDKDFFVRVDDNGRLFAIPNKGSDTYKRYGQTIVDSGPGRSLQGKLDTFNRGIAILEGLAKVDGRDPRKELAPLYNSMGLEVEDRESGNGETQGNSANKQSFLGSQIQLASYDPEDNKSPGLRDKLIDLDATEAEFISLDPVAQGAVATGRLAPMLNLIGKAEAPGGYNQIFGRGRYAPLNEMTISDVYELQRRMVKGGSESSALGRYQFINKTLRGVVQAAGLDPETTKFTPEVQDKLAGMLMQRRGLSSYLSGKISKEEFADRLAKEWAGLPLASGQSFYKGVGSNNATVRREMLMKAIDEITQQ